MKKSPQHQFNHEAMTTPFKIIIAGEEYDYAQGAAQALYAEIDRIEMLLSRFIESSDISRINVLGAKEPVRVSIETFECLKIAAKLYEDTKGAFDVTIGAAMPKEQPLSDEKILHTIENSGMDHVKLNQDDFTVSLDNGSILLDLGGIGKGYALDVAAELLEDWSIESAYLSGGGSTVLALDAPPNKPGWPVSIGSDTEFPKAIMLKHQALSGSGTNYRGEHIIDPDTGLPPATSPLRAWSMCPSAAVSDALSTAFMIMSPEEIESYCMEHVDTHAMILLENERIDFWGNPEKEE